MESPSPSNAVVALAAFVRQRLADVTGTIGGTIAPLLTRREGTEVVPATRAPRAEVSTARQLAMVVVGAAAPFAPTPQARIRLLRQMHASGLLSRREADDAVEVLTSVRPDELRVIDAEHGSWTSLDRGA